MPGDPILSALAVLLSDAAQTSAARSTVLIAIGAVLLLAFIGLVVWVLLRRSLGVSAMLDRGRKRFSRPNGPTPWEQAGERADPEDSGLPARLGPGKRHKPMHDDDPDDAGPTDPRRRPGPTK